MASTLVYEGIRKTFAGAVAIESFDLAMEPGELVSLLGPSGCGKTTALRIAAGFERPDSGAVLVDDRDVARRPAASPQHGHGLPELQPVPQPRRHRQRRLRPAGAPGDQGGTAAPCRRGARARPPLTSREALPASALRRPAAASGAGHGRSSSSRRCSSSTSRCRPSTPRSASTSARRSVGCSCNSA